MVRVGWSTVRPEGIVNLCYHSGNQREAVERCYTLDFEVAAKSGFGHVDAFEFDVYLVHLLLRLLLTVEFAERTEE